MAALFAKRPVLTTATATSVVAAAYYVSTPRQTLKMDSAQNPPVRTLSLPKNMLFSKQLKVRDVQQVNHDTKRITFQLPGGKGEVSGVTPGGMKHL
jgi:cytochrome-b5 reductase